MSTTVKHLAGKVGADERTLRRAVAQGTVRCSRVSPRRVALSEDEVQYLRSHWQLLQQLRRALRTEPNVRLAAVFGSTARGHERIDSDIDLLVDLRDDSWQRRQALNTRLEQVVGGPVDLVVLGRAKSHNASLLADTLRDGRVLVDRDHAWPALKRREDRVRRAAREDAARQADETKAALEELLTA